MPDPNELEALTEDEFRRRLRDWLEAYYPAEWRRPVVFRLRGDNERRWLRMLFDHGWRLPSWPREHGGLGLSLRKQLAYHDEMSRFGIARYLDMGGTLLGPTLIRFGSAEQKATYLPEILRGDLIWCQGYSEPNAGSDLANLKTSAVRDGDSYVVNGTKIWTTMATDAARMFLLARTSNDGRKQEGISFFLSDMDQPGITVRPIVNLAGEDEFAQVFFDNVRVPAANLVGKPGEGWSIAKSLLGTERITTSSPASAGYALNILNRITGRPDPTSPVKREAYARLLNDFSSYTALYEQIADAYAEGLIENYELSLLKLLSSSLFQRISEACLEAAGEQGGVDGTTEIDGIKEDLRLIYMVARPTSIYGGANDVQRDIISKSLFVAK